MQYLSQRDPLWVEKKLGASNSTVGRYGCTTTVISMMSDYFECYQSPLEIASNANNYQGDLILWQNLKFDKMEFDWRAHGFNPEAIKQALSNPNMAVGLEVADHSHWVLATSVSSFGKDFTIVDPWDGKKKNCLATYGNITGAVYFKRKKPTVPKISQDMKFAKELGKRDYPFFIDVDNHGELWFIHPTGEREYLAPSNIFEFIKAHAVGIKESDLLKLPIKKT